MFTLLATCVSYYGCVMWVRQYSNWWNDASFRNQCKYLIAVLPAEHFPAFYFSYHAILWMHGHCSHRLWDLFRNSLVLYNHHYEHCCLNYVTYTRCMPAILWDYVHVYTQSRRFNNSLQPLWLRHMTLNCTLQWVQRKIAKCLYVHVLEQFENKLTPLVFLNFFTYCYWFGQDLTKHPQTHRVIQD